MNAYAPSRTLTEALRALRGAVGAAAGYSLVINLLMLVPTLYMLQVYDRVLVSRNETTLMLISLIAFGMLALSALADGLRGALLVRASARFDRALAPTVFDLTRQGALEASGAGQPTGPLQDLLACRNFVGGPGAVMLFDLVWAPVYVLASYLLHPLLGAAALAFGLIQVSLAVWSRARVADRWPDYAKADADERRFLAGKLQQAEVSEVLGMVPGLVRQWGQVHAVQLDAEQGAAVVRGRMTAIAKTVRHVQQALLLTIGALLVIDGALSAGAMIAANLLVARALAPLDQLASQWQVVLGARQAYQRLAALLCQDVQALPAADMAAAASEATTGAGLHVQHGRVGVGARQAPVLHDLCLDLDAGKVMVVMGPSGSGKSTLARLLVGACPSATGTVRFAGQPLAQYLARGGALGYLPQELAWLPGTVAQQIARFDEPVDAAAVVRAAQAAGLHDTILRMPGGYDTWIDADSNTVSGGQLQRIALARALYQEPDLVVLDEPNANLDEAGERALATALLDLRRRGATVVVISHRPGVLALADNVLVLREGLVVRQCAAAALIQSPKEDASRPPAPVAS